MNSLHSLNAITRRALRVNYESPPVCLPDTEAGSGSGSGGSSTLDFLPIYRKDGPINLSATLVAGPGVYLAWDVLSYAYSYVLYESSNPEGPWTILVTGTLNNFYLDATPELGVNYYKVTALEPDAGETLPSNIAQATVV